MRSKHKKVLVALVAVLALGAVASASASASLPEFKLPREHEKEIPAKLAGEISGRITFDSILGTVTCGNGSFTGEVINSKEVAKIVFKFSEGDCNSHAFCLQSAHKSEFWETKELKGRIAYLSKKEKTVGLLLEPVTQPVAKCNEPLGEGIETIQGSIIGKLEETGTRSHFTLSYEALGAEQDIEKFEGEEAKHRLEVVQLKGHEPDRVAVGNIFKVTATDGPEGIRLEK